MTSEDFIEDWRRNGGKLSKNDGSLAEIPSDFLKRATELCNQLRCSSITYDIQTTIKEIRPTLLFR